MSVDKLRESFHINRISTVDLEDFLTAQTYRPEITSARNKVNSLDHASLQSVCATPIRQGKSPKYTEGEGLTCIKPKNTRDLIVDLSDCDAIDIQTEKAINRQKLEYGDIVITRSGSGTIGRASIFTGSGDVYTNDHLFIVRVNDADSFYVATFLKSYWGERLLEAGISGSTGQLNLSNEHIKKISLYKPNSLAQKYIGDKVRQAEKMKVLASSLYKDVDDTFKEKIGLYSRSEGIYERVPAALLGHRLDQNHYRESLLNCLETVQSHPHVFLSDSDMFETLTDGDHGNPVYGSGARYIRANEMSGNILIKEKMVGLDDSYAASVGSSCWAHDGDIVFSIVGTLGLTAVVRESTQGVMSRGVAKVRSKSLPNFYVKAFFRTNYFHDQLERHSVGSVQRGVYLSALGDIAVPIIDDNSINEIHLNEHLADSSILAANNLVRASKFLIEALIEGRIADKLLIEAQKALDADDTSVDRGILGQITTKGMDGDGDPLFADLDQLYDLLAQSQTTDD